MRNTSSSSRGEGGGQGAGWTLAVALGSQHRNNTEERDTMEIEKLIGIRSSRRGVIMEIEKLNGIWETDAP
jgi:hypothetical protein